MREKPQPKQEILVKNIGNNTLFVYVASEDARKFLIDEAWQYGSLTAPRKSGQAYWLIVMPLYNPQEVADYLESYNEVQQDETKTSE